MSPASLLTIIITLMIYATGAGGLRPSVLHYGEAIIEIACKFGNTSFVLNAQEGTLLKSDVEYDDVNWIQTQCKLDKPAEMEDSKHEEVLEFWRPDILLFTDTQNLLLLKKSSIHCYARDDSLQHPGVKAFDISTIPDGGLQYSCSENSIPALGFGIFQECVEVSARSTKPHGNMGKNCHNGGKWMIDDVGNFVCSKCCPGSRWYRDELECEKCPEHSTSKKTNVLVSACHHKRKDTRKPVTKRPISTISTTTPYSKSTEYPVMLPSTNIPPSRSEILPCNVIVSDITPHSALIQWDCGDSDGIGYHVEVIGSKQTQTRDTSEMHVLVKGLSPNMQYEVSVSVKNRDDHEARSQPKTFWTLRKHGVWQLEIANIDAVSRNVTVSWKILTEQAIQSDATAFKIYYKAIGSDKRVDVTLTDMAFASASAHFRVPDVGNYTLYVEHQSGGLVSKNFSVSLKGVQQEDADSVGSGSPLATGFGIFFAVVFCCGIFVALYCKYGKKKNSSPEGGNNDADSEESFLH